MNAFDRAVRGFAFLVSVPERSLRALAALASGTTMLLTDTLLPESVRGTRTYKVSLGMMQSYIIKRIAQIELDPENLDAEVSDDFLQRKMVGTAFEAAGLFLVGASPLWIFAILADISGGGRIFLDRLTAELLREGLIEPDQEFGRLEDVLDAVQRTSNKTVTVIDTPPLSRRAIREMMVEIRAHYSEIYRSTVDLIPTLETLWARMEAIAGGDRNLFSRLAGIMTVDALAAGNRSRRAIASAGTTGLQLFDERILGSYRQTLSTVAGEGVMGYLRSRYSPFLQAARGHFDANRKTWTERSLGGKTPE